LSLWQRPTKFSLALSGFYRDVTHCAGTFDVNLPVGGGMMSDTNHDKGTDENRPKSERKRWDRPMLRQLAAREAQGGHNPGGDSNGKGGSRDAS
jgi:hypothetical protein